MTNLTNCAFEPPLLRRWEVRRKSPDSTNLQADHPRAHRRHRHDHSFHEIGKLAGVGQYDDQGELEQVTPSNFVFGSAKLDGRSVILSGDDFTVRGGSADASIAGKRLHAEGLALELRRPHIRLVDGMGGGGSVKTIEMAGRTCILALQVGKRLFSTWVLRHRSPGSGQRCRHGAAKMPLRITRSSSNIRHK